MFLYYLLYTINALLMLVPPLILGTIIARRLGINWGLFFIGAAVFILSQVGHIPFNALILPGLNRYLESWPDTAALLIIAIFLGLSAGLFEETARYLTFKYWRKDIRTWSKGLMYGAGHGGIEAMLIGIIFILNFLTLSFYEAGLLPNLLASVPPADLPAAEAILNLQVETLFTTPWPGTLLGGIERLFAITLHLCLSLIVMQCFTRGKRRWLLAAVGLHALANAGAVTIIGLTNNGYLAELFLAFIALGSLFIIKNLKEPEPVEPELESLPPVKQVDLSEIEVTSDNLEKSRYV